MPCVLGGIPPVAWPVMADWQDQSPKPICPERPPTGGLQGRELGSHCAGTGSTGCLLWEGRAQQLGQSLVFGPPGAEGLLWKGCPERPAGGYPPMWTGQGAWFEAGHRSWLLARKGHQGGKELLSSGAAVSGRTDRRTDEREGQERGTPTHRVLLCFGWDAACLSQRPVPARAHADARSGTQADGPHRLLYPRPCPEDMRGAAEGPPESGL